MTVADILAAARKGVDDLCSDPKFRLSCVNLLIRFRKEEARHLLKELEDLEALQRQLIKEVLK